MVVVSDTIATDTIKKERLEDVLVYDADDQINNFKTKMSYLLRNARIKYQDMEIFADYVEINWETGDIFADGKRDSLGMIVEPTLFKQGIQEYEQQSFKINFNTKIGIAYNVRIEEGEGVLSGGTVKRANDSIMYVRGGDYTTDTYFIERKTKEPDYVLRTQKAKYISGTKKTMITGPINMRIYDIPTPLLLPFAYIPLGDTRSAGILIPSFGERADVGFFLEGLGFYLPISDYLDLSFTSEIYTKGSWGIHPTVNYRKRYRFSGNMRFDYENRITGIKGLPDYSHANNYRFSWTHAQDPKANPNLIFSASVNMSSSQYFRESINNNNILNGNVFTNSTASSVSINKIFPNSPFSMSLVMSQNQNNTRSNDEPAQMQFVLPQLTLNMNRIYPFAPKIGGKKGLIKNFGMGYNLNVLNNMNTNEDDAFKSQMWKDAKSGARHNLNFSTGATLGTYFPLSLNASYEEVWYLRTYEKEFDPTQNQVVQHDINGFDSYRVFNMGASVSTNLYGLWQSKKKDAAIQGIRHVLSPSVGISYWPDFSDEEWGYYDYYRGADGRKVLYSRFENTVFGAPSQGKSASLNFGIQNNLEMKVRSKTDSTGYKKIKIFEYLNITSSYNMAADQFKLSPINVTGMTRLFNQKLNLNFRMTFDPYRMEFEEGQEHGTRVNKLGPPRLVNYGVNFGYNFDNSTFGGKNFKSEDYGKRGEIRNEHFYFDEEDYAHFVIPWRLGFNLTQNYSKGTSRKGLSTTVLRLNAAVSPTPFWSLSASTSYDATANRFSQAVFSFSRDLRSFDISFSWVPFGQYKTWDFFISIKADILKDAVKYDQKPSGRMRSGNF